MGKYSNGAFKKTDRENPDQIHFCQDSRIGARGGLLRQQN
jgi:hypothetical protein